MQRLQHTRTMMGPYTDIPGPEISAGSRMMSWFFDEYSKFNRFSPACVTGKVSIMHVLHCPNVKCTAYAAMMAVCICQCQPVEAE